MADKKPNVIPAAGEREHFTSQWGFILACVGSAVGLANVWAFPYRVAQFGGAGYVIPYLICAILLGLIGVAAEIAFGRWGKAGPMGTFRKALESKGKNGKIGTGLGVIPVLGSLAIATGYAIVVGWVLRYLWTSITGSLFTAADTGAYFGAITGNFGSVGWHLLALAISVAIMMAGVVDGIERINKIMMPLFFVLLIYMVIRVAFLDGVGEGYRFLLIPDWSAMANPKIWAFALGQCFFSLSLAGSGTVVFGSYTTPKENCFQSSFWIVFLDTISAIMATLIIIPAMFAFNMNPEISGPPLVFIVLPQIFGGMVGGRIFSAIFFLTLVFAAVPAIVNLFETPIEAVQQHFKLSRKKASAVVVGVATVAGLFMESGDIVGAWMDLVSIYVVPIGAIFSAVLFFWFMGKEFGREQVQIGREKTVGGWFVPTGRYIFVVITIIVFIGGMLIPGMV